MEIAIAAPDVEIHLDYEDTSGVRVEVEGSNAHIGGYVTVDLDEVYGDVDLSYIIDVIKDAGESTLEEARELLGASNDAPLTVYEFYDGMDASQKAYMFNKLLERRDYNVADVSIVQLLGAVLDALSKQREDTVQKELPQS